MAGGDQKAWARGQLKVFFVTDRFGSFAEISERRTHVCFDPESRHPRATRTCLLRANKRHRELDLIRKRPPTETVKDMNDANDLAVGGKGCGGSGFRVACCLRRSRILVP
jgi:hypothetical protein